MATENRINFWRRKAKLPGRYHKDTKTKLNNLKTKKASSFHEFAHSTSDAWDIGEEEDEESLRSPAPSATPPDLSMQTKNHRCDTETSCRPEPPSSDSRHFQEENKELQHLNRKVIRSTSDTQVSSSSDTFTYVASPHSFGSKLIEPDQSWLQNFICVGNAFSLLKQSALPVRPLIPLVARISDQNASGALPMTVREKSRLDKFKLLLASPSTDLGEPVCPLYSSLLPGSPLSADWLVKKLKSCGSTAGLEYREKSDRPHGGSSQSVTIVYILIHTSGPTQEMLTSPLWQGYLPANRGRRELVLQRKRDEYFAFIEQYYQSRTEEHHRDTYRQIHIDIPRTNPLIPLFQQPTVQEVFERILFIWAIRHPASGYVQGINDLVTPFFVVFLSEFVMEDVENFEMSALPLQTQRNIEADSFWCMSKLLDGIQDNYTFAQPGIQNKVKALEELVSRMDEDVHAHLVRCEVEYLQFAFRWMNNLLMRELPLRCTIRLWDTYQAEAEGFSHFHLFVCAAFLLEWRKQILSMSDFQGLLMLLQNLPTIHWGNEEVGLLLAEAYRLKYMFADAPSHYKR
ncbi:TBC1 domain family member 22B [Takifugu flavidus]|uniref:TBC1 domain family member 22B n=1 Tax=Takifugu flavidus TaxID=433684 RepID=A0A5C6MUT6_9TELE|nr:TBC1 domain family member 22B [Takifugu flavidus]